MRTLKPFLILLAQWICSVLRYVWDALPAGVRVWAAPPDCQGLSSSGPEAEEWRHSDALRTYLSGHDGATTVWVQTDTHVFHAGLQTLCEGSQYFRGVSRAGMTEMSEGVVRLRHVPSSVFRNFLEFSFHQRLSVPEDELAAHLQLASYLLAEPFLSECLALLARLLTPDNCVSYLDLAKDLCCIRLRTTVLTYLSRHLLELSHLTRGSEEREELIALRTRGDQRLCILRKENLEARGHLETARVRQLFRMGDGADPSWNPISELPFRADKWSFTAVVLFNYLYILGGYRQPIRRGWEFKMASFRYNPYTDTWVRTAPMIKRRRHFSAVACGGGLYAVGGWYLDSLLGPDSNTALYTAVERYDPWDDTWRFVSSLPLTGFQFTVSLSHDVPLATSLGPCVYVLGNVQRTGEKLVLQYDTMRDRWCELLPTLTRADTELPTLYFLGATDVLIVIGGNASENVVTSFCPRTQRWGEVQRAPKVALAGQGVVLEGRVVMPSADHRGVVRLHLKDLSMSLLPPLPPPHYDAVFHLFF